MQNDLMPMRRSDTLAEYLAQETLVYVAADEAVHVLNPTARLLWELCDGQHDLDAMVTHIRAAFQVSADVDLRTDVEAALRLFAAKSLLL